MDKVYEGQERRESERIDVNFTVIYRVNSPLSIRMMVGDREVIAIAVNLSEGGMAISTTYELPVSTIVRVKYILLNEKASSISERMKSIEVLGEVCHSFLAKDKSYCMGIRFLDLSGSDKLFIANFVKLQKRP
ncbi:MAG: PilZ domain-containing protein [Candidatus Omnitrophota bacterium]